jgi:hypothetical protein
MMKIFEGKLNWTEKSTHTPRDIDCVGFAGSTCQEIKCGD